MEGREKSDAPAEIVNDDILRGPRLKGHRISVVDIYDLLDAGETIASIAETTYPVLRETQVRAAVEYIETHEDEVEHLWETK